MPATSITEALAAYVLADPSDSEHVGACAQAATLLVDQKIASVRVPEEIRQAAILEVAANLFNRRASARDSATAVDADTAPAFFRPALDPMTPAWPLLAPYLTGPGIA
ncbi:hypothetical protein [Schaalia sp.]|uniref:hypothetical protein n=1 Tax=Schaalia sp. TaxID=2691890 RepID=UPI003D131DBC